MPGACSGRCHLWPGSRSLSIGTNSGALSFFPVFFLIDDGAFLTRNRKRLSHAQIRPRWYKWYCRSLVECRARGGKRRHQGETHAFCSNRIRGPGVERRGGRLGPIAGHCREKQHGARRLRRAAGAQRLPAAGAQAGRSLDRLHRPPRRPLDESAHGRGRGQRHVDPRRDRPGNPKPLFHIPGEPGEGETGGAQMVRVCDGATLPKGDKSKFYLLRTVRQRRARDLGRDRSRAARAPHHGREGAQGHAQELVGMRYRHRVPRLRASTAGARGA